MQYASFSRSARQAPSLPRGINILSNRLSPYRTVAQSIETLIIVASLFRFRRNSSALSLFPLIVIFETETPKIFAAPARPKRFGNPLPGSP
jgi:hypothetical protein